MLLSGICNRTIPLSFSWIFPVIYAATAASTRRREDSCFQRAVWLRQPPRYPFFPPADHLAASPPTGIHRRWFCHRFFTLHRYGTGATSFLSPLPRIPLRKCISGERAFSDVTHVQIRTHARIARSFTLTLTRTYTRARATRTRIEPGCCTVKGKSVRAGECVRGVLLFPLPSSPDFEDSA